MEYLMFTLKSFTIAHVSKKKKVYELFKVSNMFPWSQRDNSRIGYQGETCHQVSWGSSTTESQPATNGWCSGGCWLTLALEGVKLVFKDSSRDYVPKGMREEKTTGNCT